MEFACRECGSTYEARAYRATRTKYCSLTCKGRAAGKIGGAAGKGVSRNKGSKRPDLSERNKVIRYAGSSSGMWKGNDVGYIAMHNWAHYHVGLKDTCVLCGGTNRLEMSNRSGKYKREKEDWWTLCKRCHAEYDAEFHRNGGVSRKLHRWKKQKPLS